MGELWVMRMNKDEGMLALSKMLEENLKSLQQKEEPDESYIQWIMGTRAYRRSYVRDIMIYRHTQRCMERQGIDLSCVMRTPLMCVVDAHLSRVKESGYDEVITEINERKTCEQEREKLSSDVSYREAVSNLIKKVMESRAQWMTTWRGLSHPVSPPLGGTRAYLKWVERMTDAPASLEEWSEEHRQWTYDHVDAHIRLIIPEMREAVYEIMASHLNTIRTMK